MPSNIPVADVDPDLYPGDDNEDDVEMDSDSGSDPDSSSASSDTTSDSSSASSDTTSDSESSDGTSDSDSDAAPVPSTSTHGQTLPPRMIKPLPARAQGRNQQNQQGTMSPNTRPEIVVLSESNDADRSTSP